MKQTANVILLLLCIPTGLFVVYVLFRLAGAGWYKSKKEQLTNFSKRRKP